MPESVTDRCTKAHEYIFLLTKSARYWYDAEAVKEESVYPEGSREDVPQGVFKGKRDGSDGTNGAFRAIRNTRNRRSVWTVPTKPYSGAHFAVFPPDLIKPCILAGCPDQCCPKCGKGWERVVEKAERIQAHWEGTIQEHAIKAKEKHGKTSVIETGSYQTYRTLGFRPTCTCPEHKPVSGTVLDPFNGSGTTGLVALQTNRKYVGCELNPEYIELTRKRLESEMAQGRLELGGG
jgi:hypothetical protein